VGAFPEYLIACGTIKEFAEAVVYIRINPVANGFFALRQQGRIASHAPGEGFLFSAKRRKIVQFGITPDGDGF